MESYYPAYRFGVSKPLTGHMFNRVSSMDEHITSSEGKLAVVSEKLISTVNVYPNPVTGSSVSLRLNHVAEGHYQVQIFRLNGQLVQSFTLYHDGTSLLQKITLPSDFVQGKYELKVSGNQFVSVIPLLKK